MTTSKRVVQWDTELLTALAEKSGVHIQSIRNQVMFLARVLGFKLPKTRKYRRTEK